MCFRNEISVDIAIITIEDILKNSNDLLTTAFLCSNYE